MLIIVQTPLFTTLLVGLGASVIGAAITALVAYIVSLRRSDSLGDLEHDLAKAASIFEQGLINETEYDRVRGQMLECYHYTRGSRINVLGTARWGALSGLLVPLMLVLSTPYAGPYLLISLVTGAAGVAVSAASTVVVVYIRQEMARHQLGAGHSPLIDASSQPRV